MIIDDIAREIWRKESAAAVQNERPRLIIYIDNDTYRHMMGEIMGPVSCAAMGVINEGTIYGYPIYRVASVGHAKHVGHYWKVLTDA